MEFALGHKKTCTLYFHNLKFDGEFLIQWLFRNGYEFVKDRRGLKRDKTFTTLISDTGNFYSMQIREKYDDSEKGRHKDIKIYDSLKILPFSIKEMAKAFDLTMSKLELDYTEYREPGHELTQHEIDYIHNDVCIAAQAIQHLFDLNLTRMTTASNALSEYKEIFGKARFERDFPPPQYDEDVRRSYKGGWTYLNPKYAEADIGAGIVLDVNSLYPSVMYDCPLPYGEGIYFDGKYEPDHFYNLYVQAFSCQFELKPNHVATLQIKNNMSFVPTEYLTSSNGEYVNLWLTCVDLELFFDHYDVYDVTWHGGWKWRSSNILFRDYIDKWSGIKIEATKTGNKPMRTIAKLMLNSLYGKFATSPKVKLKYPELDEFGIVRYRMGDPEEREPIYIPVGTFVTAWARNKTIRSAKKVYNRFVYADTDSLHLIGTEIPEGLDIDDTRLGAWKHESTFTRARFLRQKSYIEEIDGKFKITCAGMPESCYPYVTWDNFHSGQSYAGKLTPMHVNGGIVLNETSFTLRK